MILYLDDDAASPLLATLLRKAGHDVVVPGDIGMNGKPDPAHLKYAIHNSRVCLSKNYDDFLLLHELILESRGSHPGILVVRQENNPSRDMTPKGIVAAIRKLVSAAVPIENEYVVLNHRR
jgi:predicted nuclease of predicted toxin-antitoxin system